jgi:hypothetical protein
MRSAFFYRGWSPASVSRIARVPSRLVAARRLLPSFRVESPGAAATVRCSVRPSSVCFTIGLQGDHDWVIVAASTVAIVAIAAAIIVVALVLWYVLPRGGRRRPPRV